MADAILSPEEESELRAHPMLEMVLGGTPSPIVSVLRIWATLDAERARAEVAEARVKELERERDAAYSDGVTAAEDRHVNEVSDANARCIEADRARYAAERERDDAIKNEWGEVVAKERDEALARYEEMHAALDGALGQLRQEEHKRTDAERERDEAREAEATAIEAKDAAYYALNDALADAAALREALDWSINDSSNEPCVYCAQGRVCLAHAALKKGTKL